MTLESPGTITAITVLSFPTPLSLHHKPNDTRSDRVPLPWLGSETRQDFLPTSTSLNHIDLTDLHFISVLFPYHHNTNTDNNDDNNGPCLKLAYHHDNNTTSSTA